MNSEHEGTNIVFQQRFRRLKVWDKSMELIGNIYQLTNHFPQSEQFGLSSQLRRSVTSITLNIAEGSGNDSAVEFKRFLTIALRSLYELICGIEIAAKLNYLESEQVKSLLKQCNELAAMICGLRKKIANPTISS